MWWVPRCAAFDVVDSELVFQEADAGDREAAKRRIDYISSVDSRMKEQVASRKVVSFPPKPAKKKAVA